MLLEQKKINKSFCKSKSLCNFAPDFALIKNVDTIFIRKIY